MLCIWKGDVLVFGNQGDSPSESIYGGRAWDPAGSHDNSKSEPVGVLEALPVFLSMRRSLLAANGGDLYNLYDSARFEQRAHKSRLAGTACRKDWQINASHGHDLRRTRRAVRALKESCCYGTL
jgi:hypothetical protein